MTDITCPIKTPTATLLGSTTSRDDIASLSPLPPQGPRHRPRTHLRIIESLTEALDHHGLAVTDEQFSVSGKNNAKLMGTMRVVPRSPDHEAAVALRSDADWALAFRSSQDRSWGLQMTAGLHVLVCSNGMLSGSDGKILKRRHVRSLDLQRRLREAVEGYVVQQMDVVALTDQAKHESISDMKAKSLIVDTFNSKRVNISPRLFREVVSNYFEPEPDWTDITSHPGTRWSLYNSYTRALRDTPTRPRHRVTQALAFLLDPSRN